MSEIQYVTGDATEPTRRPATIVHIVNDANAFGAGFASVLARKWPITKMNYHIWMESRFRGLGEYQIMRVASDVWVCHAWAQHGLRSRINPHPVQLAALELCLARIFSALKTTSQQPMTVHMPRIGCGLGGATWNEIEPIIQRTLCRHDIEVYVYELPGKQDK